MQILISILAYVVAVGILVTIHEFGHFIVARRLGIKVLRFSIGFGKALYSWRRKGDETEYVIAAIPLGGYVKMSDEREGAVAKADLPRAFNRQSIPRRFAVVVAGPVFNLLLAVFAYWIIFMAGVTSLKPVVAYVAPDSIAAQAGVQPGDQILSVSGDVTATWDDVQLDLFREILRSPSIPLTVQGPGGQRILTLAIGDPQKLTEPNQMLNGLGLSFVPQMPVVGEVTAGDAAAAAGLEVGDRIVSVDGTPAASWPDVVHTLRASAGKTLALVVSRGGGNLH
ncbi:MAG TPA: RIP metalloprotease RseP, partial [Gammaproteobacteria bacterium]